MKAYKNIKSPHPDNLYVNIILLLLFFMIGVCVVRACKSPDLSVKNSNFNQTFVSLYVDENCFDIGYHVP